jgi:hypothetical protein
VVLLVLAMWQLSRGGRPALRLWGLVTMAGAFWILTGLTRASESTGYDGRYLYTGALFVLLLAVELARGRRAPRAAQVVLGIVALGALVSNVGALRDGARFLRLQAPAARADLAALDIGRPLVGPRYAALSFPGSPLITVLAGPYYSAEKAFGTPAYSQAQLATAAEPDRDLADAELTRMHRVGLKGPRIAFAGAAPPQVDSVSGGKVSTRGNCVTLHPADFGPPSTMPALAFTLPDTGASLYARGGSDSVTLRRFGTQFPTTPLSDLSGGAFLEIAPDLSAAEWHVRLQGNATVSACGVL